MTIGTAIERLASKAKSVTEHFVHAVTEAEMCRVRQELEFHRVLYDDWRDPNLPPLSKVDRWVAFEK